MFKFKKEIEKAIQESKLNGHKWKITKNGLWWSYSESEFVFEYRLCDNEDNLLFVKDVLQGNCPIGYLVGTSIIADFNSIEKAVYSATKAIIEYCNYVY